MKYTLYEFKQDRILTRCYALSTDTSFSNDPDMIIIGVARTKKEADKLIKDLGEYELIN